MEQDREHVYPLLQVADDVYQLQLPLISAVQQMINCYLLYATIGWTILDTGFNSPSTRQGWQTAFELLGIHPKAIHQIILTHSHPDHCGAAGWLQQHYGEHPPVRLSRRDTELMTEVWGLPINQLEPVRSFLCMHGIPRELTVEIAQSIGQMRRFVQPYPTIEPILPGDTIRMGNRSVVALPTPGHTDGHMMFYDSSDKLLFCGDHVLRDVPSHTGTWPESEPNPLGRYLDSLQELSSLDVRLALPGHGQAITQWHARLKELEQHHTTRLQRTYQMVQGQMTAYEVSAQTRDVATLAPDEILLTVGVTVSRLELLTQRSLLNRSLISGEVRYQRQVDGPQSEVL